MNVEDKIENLPFMTRIINDMARDDDFDFCFTKHCEDRKELRMFTTGDIIFILKTGRLIEYQGKGKFKGENKIHKYKIRGVYLGDDSNRDVDLIILVEIDRIKNPAIKLEKIVTAMWKA